MNDCDWSKEELQRLRKYAREDSLNNPFRTHARLALAYADGVGIRLSADEVAALIEGDDAVMTAQGNLASGQYGEPGEPPKLATRNLWRRP